MPTPNLKTIAVLPYREFSKALSACLRDDLGWVVFLDPLIIERTRMALQRLIESLDKQLREAHEPIEPGWVHNVNRLREIAVLRLVNMPPAKPTVTTFAESSTREARDWRALCAQLAGVLEKTNPAALDSFQAPYGGMTVAQWLKARREKELSR